jgi:ERCC4-related helicase
MMGMGGPQVDRVAKITTFAQKTALEKFRRGDINLMIVTRVAEEGVDMLVLYLYLIC